MFIVYDESDNCIWGTGDTEQRAIWDAERWVRNWIGDLTYQRTDPSQNEYFCSISPHGPPPDKLKTCEATERLVEKVRKDGIAPEEFHVTNGLADLVEEK